MIATMRVYEANPLSLDSIDIHIEGENSYKIMEKAAVITDALWQLTDVTEIQVEIVKEK